MNRSDSKGFFPIYKNFSCLYQAMVVSIDKATALKMYDKVQKYWGKYIDELNIRLASATTLKAVGLMPGGAGRDKRRRKSKGPAIRPILDTL